MTTGKLKHSTKTADEIGQEIVSYITNLHIELENPNISTQERATINEKIDLLEALLDSCGLV